MTKKCRICNEEKVLTDFNTNFKTKDGRFRECKSCLSKKYFEKKGFYFAGRLAEYKYINTDQAIEIGISVANRILLSNFKRKKLKIDYSYFKKIKPNSNQIA